VIFILKESEETQQIRTGIKKGRHVFMMKTIES